MSFCLEGEGDLELSELLDDPEFDLDFPPLLCGLLSGERPGRDLTGLRRLGDTLRRLGGDLLLGDFERRL